MKFYLISRVADDKNFFVDLIYALHLAKSKYNLDVNLVFVGAIYSLPIYNTLQRMIDLLDLTNYIKFTGKSIRFEEMDEDMRNGYFLNFSVGKFIGYSSIESIKYGLKTLFYNVDSRYSNDLLKSSKSYISNHLSFIEIMKQIQINKEQFDRELLGENKDMLDNIKLTVAEKIKLLSMFS